MGLTFINKKIGFIGTGQMATALASGLINKDVVDASKIFGFDVYDVSATRFRTNTGGTLLGTAHEVLAQCDIVFLGVKPYQMGQLLGDLSTHDDIRRSRNPNITAGKIIVSIAAGIQLATYMKYLGNQVALVRVMPNTPCLIGEAASGYCLSPAITRDDADLVKGLLETVGVAVEVTESLMDAVTGLSGSGPAYVFTMIEALADGGVKMGLPRDIALRLAAQTFKGAAQMVLATGDHPAVLKDRVTSPGGTTITGLAALEEAGFRHALIHAVESATHRSAELGK
ncbi:MAG TPA: pyrroline-5-carboxylate reductase [Planctomycetaceae bacterium]|nr:pyrroline-5-carboxylate reductase [Planctomycetaceae bacterium]